MQQLVKLVRAESLMMLLTATLPPTRENELWDRMVFMAEEVKLFRASTTPRNVRYVVRRHRYRGLGDDQELIGQCVQRLLGRCLTGKIVVHYNSVAKVEALAGELGCEAYHHGAEEKSRKLEEFRHG